MGVFTRPGQETYNRILQNARTNGDPIGPKYHMLDAQLKRWERRQSNLNQLAQARSAKQTKKAVEKVKSNLAGIKERITNIKSKISATTKEAAQVEAARGKLAKEFAQTLSKAYKQDRVDHIKSVGNGL